MKGVTPKLLLQTPQIGEGLVDKLALDDGPIRCCQTASVGFIQYKMVCIFVLKTSLRVMYKTLSQIKTPFI